MSQPGALLVNLGSPDSPSTADVRRFLREFLMDPRVLDLPWPVRFFVVHGLILPRRSAASAEAYRSIWLPEGSPLIVHGRRLLSGLRARVDCPVELAMRYQNPSIHSALRRLAAQGVDDLLLIPLFPHYAMSSYETAVDRVRRVRSRVAPQMRLTVHPPYGNHPEYLTALTASAASHLHREHDHLLFSFHGIPERHLRKSDPTRRHCLSRADCCWVPSEAHATCYRAQCYQTMSAFVARTGTTRYSISFQSRVGNQPWLTPYTDLELVRLARAGVRRLLVVCPAFVADCLETLEEIGIRGRARFREAGGETLELIPCLNDHPLWITALQKMIDRFCRGPVGDGPKASSPGTANQAT